MRHSFRFPEHVKQAVRTHVRRAISSVDQRRFRQEPVYTAALIHALEGVAYEDSDGFVSMRATIADSIGPGTAESWSGADFAITAIVRQGHSSIEKAILVQAKLGGLDELSQDEHERLVTQIRDMTRHTRSPKVMVVPLVNGAREPRMLSGRHILSGQSPRGIALPEYVTTRVTTTLDGDTRRHFVNGVQESTFNQLRIHAEMHGPRVRLAVPERVKIRT